MLKQNQRGKLLLNLILSILLLGKGTILWGGTTGKLAGRMSNQKGEGLAGGNIIISKTSQGAASDAEGYYFILNLPPGLYDVKFSYMGYQSKVIQNVSISADKTTHLDVVLNESVMEGEAVTVVAERPVVELNVTSSLTSVGKDDIEVMPVLHLQDVVELQAGVVDGHFRGGRLSEVQYQVNGVSVNNVYDNSMSLQLDRSLLQEVQVISGTFDAEYGQAMSGVVNAILKSGESHFAWNLETFLSDYIYTSGDRRNEPDKFRPFSSHSYQLSLSGPLKPLPQTYFIASARRYLDQGYIFGEKVFLPTDSSDFELKIFNPTGDRSEFPLFESDEITGLFKLTNTSLGRIKIEYQAILNLIKGHRYNFAYRYLPDGRAIQTTQSLVHGIDISHTLSSTTFYTLNLRQNFYQYTDFLYEDVYDSRYDKAGPAIRDQSYDGINAVLQGVELTRFKQTTNSYIAKAAITSQINRIHQVKFGSELLFSNLEFGVPGYLIASGLLLTRHVNEPPDYPDVQVYHPFFSVFYAQDQIELKDLLLRVGLRWEYFDAHSTIPSDLANPANAIEGAPESKAQSTTAKSSLAPRLGVSYPITATSSAYFAYGHFYQMPSLGEVFRNSDYSVLAELQSGGISYGVMGNPDIKPEKTIQYEFGYKQAITPDLGVSLSLFYKDIRDLLGVEFISTYAAAEYARLTNVDFGNVTGVTMTIDQRNLGNMSIYLDYTWQRAMGNSSDPRETATRAAAGEDPRPRLIPLNWDQRHTLNLTLIFSEADNYNLSAIGRYGSGQPYTPSIREGFGGDLECNSARKSDAFRIDLRGEKTFHLAKIRSGIYIRIENLLDTRSVNGFVFNDTGSPDYTLNPTGQAATLADPNRYYPPRRIEVGINFSKR